MRDPLADASERSDTAEPSTPDDEQVGVFRQYVEQVQHALVVLFELRRHRTGAVEVDERLARRNDGPKRGSVTVGELQCSVEGRLDPGDPSTPTTILHGQVRRSCGLRATSTEHGASCRRCVVTDPWRDACRAAVVARPHDRERRVGAADLLLQTVEWIALEEPGLDAVEVAGERLRLVRRPARLVCELLGDLRHAEPLA